MSVEDLMSAEATGTQARPQTGLDAKVDWRNPSIVRLCIRNGCPLIGPKKYSQFLLPVDATPAIAFNAAVIIGINEHDGEEFLETVAKCRLSKNVKDQFRVVIAQLKANNRKEKN